MQQHGPGRTSARKPIAMTALAENLRLRCCSSGSHCPTTLSSIAGKDIHLVTLRYSVQSKRGFVVNDHARQGQVGSTSRTGGRVAHGCFAAGVGGANFFNSTSCWFIWSDAVISDKPAAASRKSRS